jgi:hypothetical protein
MEYPSFDPISYYGLFAHFSANNNSRATDAQLILNRSNTQEFVVTAFACFENSIYLFFLGYAMSFV